MRNSVARSTMTFVLVFALFMSIPMPGRAEEPLEASQAIVDIIKRYEGYVEYPVWDNGQYSVGYGTRCPDDKVQEYLANGITKEAAEALLKDCISYFSNAINKFAATYGITYTQEEFDALVSISYNCGIGWTRETTGYLFAAAKNKTKGNELIYAFSLWSKGGGIGLLYRRLSEANLFNNGIYDVRRPANYTYVYFDGNGGTLAYDVQGYDRDSGKVPFLVHIEETQEIVRDGETKTYTFDGWYTQRVGGDKVEALDDSLTEAQVLYAHWVDAEGGIADPNIPGTPCDYTVKVTGMGVNIREDAGVNFTILGSVNKDTELHLTQTKKDFQGFLWGYFEAEELSGWISLEYTDYLYVIGQAGMATICVNDYLNIRTGPGVNYALSGKVYYGGDIVEILEQKNGWGRTELGWVSMDYVTMGAVIQDPTDPTQPSTEPTQPSTDPTQPSTDPTQPSTDPTQPSTEPTQPSTEPTQPSTEPTQPSTEPTQPSTEPTKPYEPWTGTVKADPWLNIRSEADANSPVVGYLPDGSKVVIINEKTVNNQRWGQVDGGWVSLSYVTVGYTEPTQPDTQNTTPTTQPTVPPTQPPTQPTKPSESSAPTQPTTPYESWRGVVTVDTGLRIRQNPGVTETVIGTLYNGEIVTIFEEKTVGSIRWGRMERGWISLSYVAVYVEPTLPSTQPTVPTTAPTKPTAVTTVPPTPGTEPPVNAAVVQGKWSGKISARTRVVLRAAPGFAGAVIDNLLANSSVGITELTYTDGKLWGYNGKGWICMDYVTLDGSVDHLPTDMAATSQGVSVVLDTPLEVTVNTYSLRLRSQGEDDGSIVGFLTMGQTIQVTEVCTVGNNRWGKTDGGWIDLKYVK